MTASSAFCAVVPPRASPDLVARRGMDSLDQFVPKVKHPLAPDAKEAAAIERRRAAEAARQERIFNVKQRTIGVCCPAN